MFPMRLLETVLLLVPLQLVTQLGWLALRDAKGFHGGGLQQVTVVIMHGDKTAAADVEPALDGSAKDQRTSRKVVNDIGLMGGAAIDVEVGAGDPREKGRFDG